MKLKSAWIQCVWAYSWVWFHSAPEDEFCFGPNVGFWFFFSTWISCLIVDLNWFFVFIFIYFTFFFLLPQCDIFCHWNLSYPWSHMLLCLVSLISILFFGPFPLILNRLQILESGFTHSLWNTEDSKVILMFSTFARLISLMEEELKKNATTGPTNFHLDNYPNLWYQL